MLKVPDIQSIRAMHQRGVPIREIARRLHVSRKTVRKYVADDFVVEPHTKARLRKKRPAPKMDRWKPVVAGWVAHDEAEVKRKQRRTARRIYRQLREEYGQAVEASEETVRRYVRKLKGVRSREAYVPLEFAPGAMMEVDFGHAEVILAGQEASLPFIAMRLMHSTASFVKAFRHMQREAWLDGLVSGLSFFGGVSSQALFDNDSALVREILAGGKRLQTPEFVALAAHYGFEAVFANPGRGNEKGGVEHLVRWAQQNVFSPVPEVGSLAELNERARQECLQDAQRRHKGGRLVTELWDGEQAQLGTLPAKPFDACRKRFVRVDKTLLVHYEGVQYSAPADYAQKALLLRVFWDRVEIADGQRTVAVHQRRSKGDPPSLQLEHYLPVLARKSRAARHAAVIAHGAPEIARYRDGFLSGRPEATRELVAILRLSEEVGLEALSRALAVAEEHHAYDLESVRAVLAMATESAPHEPLPDSAMAHWPRAEIGTVDSAVYGWLTEVAAGGEQQ